MDTINSTEVMPVISRVTGVSGDVGKGGVTTDRALTVYGTAGPSVEVDVWDGSLSAGHARANSNGDWSFNLTALTLTDHGITAMTVGGRLVSESWALTVVSAMVEDFEAAQEGVIAVGQSRVLAFMTITALAGSIYLGNSLNSPPYLTGKSLSIYGTVALRLSRSVRKVKFAADLYGRDGPVSFYFYGEQQQLIHTFVFSSFNKTDWFEFEFSGVKIKEIKVVASAVDNSVASAAFLDNFTFVN